MNEKLRESVSALVDGEADDLELRRLLASADDVAVRTAWRDFHLQRDSLNGVDMQFAHIDLSQRIQQALADDVAPAAVAGARWWRSLASVAVAASVATVVAVGARSVGPLSENRGASNSVAMAQVAAPSTVNRVVPAQSGPAFGNVAVSAQLNSPFYPVQPAALNPDQLAQQRLQQYLLRHTERAALNNGQGVIGFAKVSQLKAE
jgi:sigma-E factor negative regulatory protein RseA